jgi:hypothetical protein
MALSTGVRNPHAILTRIWCWSIYLKNCYPDADQKQTLYASSCSAFQRIEWPTFAYKWNIKYENFALGKLSSKYIIYSNRHSLYDLSHVCHNELFLPNLWKCRYHVYWNLSYPLSILKVNSLSRWDQRLCNQNKNSIIRWLACNM